MGSENQSELVSIGLVRKPVGLSGWMGVTPYGATMELISLPCRIYVKKPGGTSIEEFRLLDLKRHPKGYRAKFDTIDTLEKAEPFRNAEVLISGEQLPPMDDDVYYHFELEGMEVVVDDTSQTLGTVVTVHNYPSVDALEIRRCNREDVIIVPLTPEAVKQINRDKHFLVLDGSVLEEIL
ncbi:MAG: ribosome maturation factor RimM [Chitinivibrionales bacterium]